MKGALKILITILVVCNIAYFAYSKIEKETRGFLVIQTDFYGPYRHNKAGNERIYFAWDNSGYAVASEWIRKEDVFLVHRSSTEEKIKNIKAKNLFGNFKKSYLWDLLKYDSSLNGIIDSQDKNWSELFFWQDKNSDGHVQKDEVKSLDEARIKSISLWSRKVNFSYGEDQPFQAFVPKIDERNTVYAADYEFNFSTAFMPNIRGFSKIPDLLVAMNLNVKLLEKVIDLCLMPADLTFSLADDVNGRVEEIMLMWANVADGPLDSRGPYIDARKLSFLEKYLGTEYSNLEDGNKNPKPGAARGLLNIWDQMLAQNKAKILFQCQGEKFVSEEAHFDRAQDKIIMPAEVVGVSDATLLNFIALEKKIVDDSTYWQNVISFLEIIFSLESADSLIPRIQNLKKNSATK